MADEPQQVLSISPQPPRYEVSVIEMILHSCTCLWVFAVNERVCNPFVAVLQCCRCYCSHFSVLLCCTLK